uniref:Myosin-2 essential light chain n=1 Tax=Lepeophtheirus salmonis TaxID=72036 RepID=C1BUF4_LEPSM|nr:Myosin-2 essential light chain [Lepeophtheirus salmonis]
MSGSSPRITFTDDQIADFQETFALYDNRGDGKIPVGVVGDVMRALWQNPTESEVKKLVIQERADERVSFEVFLPILQAICSRRSSDTAEGFVEGLRHFDKDGNGFISTAELRHLLTTLGEKLSDEEVEQLLAGHEDSQGNVNYEEFVRTVMKG